MMQWRPSSVSVKTAWPPADGEVSVMGADCCGDASSLVKAMPEMGRASDASVGSVNPSMSGERVPSESV